MKEVLIYGALVAAIIGASVPIIQGMSVNVTNAGTAINSQVQTQLDAIANPSGTTAQ